MTQHNFPSKKGLSPFSVHCPLPVVGSGQWGSGEVGRRRDEETKRQRDRKKTKRRQAESPTASRRERGHPARHADDSRSPSHPDFLGQPGGLLVAALPAVDHGSFGSATKPASRHDKRTSIRYAPLGLPASSPAPPAGRGRGGRYPPLPPNRACGFPAHGSPENGAFHSKRA